MKHIVLVLSLIAFGLGNAGCARTSKAFNVLVGSEDDAATPSASSTQQTATTAASTPAASPPPDLAAAQKLLNELGYDAGVADGIAGNKTRKAIQDYETDKGLAVDGVLDADVYASLTRDANSAKQAPVNSAPPAAQPTAPPPVSKQIIPASSPMAQVQAGMGEGQVNSILGVPSDTEVYATGKTFIPFYFGRDHVRKRHYYKGQGSVVMGGNQRVVEVIYDPTEDGFQ
jgi:peptidoglycan hydrolase-like protein with peptidoglycan-binding domain